ncbi:hypothetical protein Sste5346_009600 [Sporothrix stenoceras]|uniref:Oxidoreductase-like protein n=1 Tax=Sporothrix stenoceras TaxID=5173 RepID=A0ABR3YJJ6_9PEZI
MRDDRVEAGSLADLNLLAANPPRYPVNPTEEPREPLTLYISRVPGTRDIILSTLKPQKKNVTSEDVANALYYVHLDLPSDGLLVAPPTMPAAAATASQGGGSPTAALTPTVSRKPVPSTAPRPGDNTLPPGPSTGPSSSSTFPTGPTGPAPPVGYPASSTFPPTGPAPPVGGYPSGPPPAYTSTGAQPPAPPTQQPEQPPAPPPHREPVSPRPQPWVPPGFRLEERQSSFEAAVMSSLDNLPSQQGQQQQQQQQSRPLSGQAFPATSTLPIRSRPLPGRTLPSNTSNNSNAVQPPPGTAPNPGATITRKPVGPRPDGAVDPNAPPFPPRPQDRALPQAPAQQQQQQPRPPGLTSSQPTPSNFVPFQLTLIRRDPSSNHQWNIGKVASVQQVEQPDDEGSDGGESVPAVSEQPSIRIHLETSGYAKFRGDDGGKAFARQVVMAYTKSWTAGIRNAFKRPSSNSHERSSSLDGAQSFGRGAFPQDNSDLEPPRRFLRPRNNSLASTADTALGGLGGIDDPRRRSKEMSRSTSPPLITRPGPGLKPKGYTFTSPWDGRCDFRTGNGGRSLKCRHILHPSADSTTGATGGGVAGYNPLVIAQSFRDGPGQGLAAVAAATSSVVTGQPEGGGRARAGSLTSALTGAVAVSELRFNLPHGDLIRRREGSEERERERGGRRDELYGRFQDHLHHLQHHTRRRSSTEEDDEYQDDDEDELDLRLGREKAGGGNRGKRAKLGKLIVYDDGFKMLDLVVAANMGVWWVSWERAF